MSAPLRVHLLAPPNTQTTAAYALDGFTQATIRFARVLDRLGAEVLVYGSEESEAPCAEHVCCLPRAVQARLLGDTPYQYAAYAGRRAEALWGVANAGAIDAIAQRKRPRDYLCLIGGASQRAVAAAHPDLLCVEYSVGYRWSFAPHRVFQSHAWRHAVGGTDVPGRHFDQTIPYFFDPADYPFRVDKAPYAVYVGRLTHDKGVGVACEAAALAGVPLYVIGHGNPRLVTHGATYLGELPTAERDRWVAGASALLAPTLYVEPFGAVVVEAALCGTPAITTDFGAFPETVEEGVTGYRCHTLGEFARALERVRGLDPRRIRARAESLYSLDAVTPQYRAYFARLALLWERGWETP